MTYRSDGGVRELIGLCICIVTIVLLYRTAWGMPPYDPARGIGPRTVQIVKWPFQKTWHDTKRTLNIP